MKEYEKLCHNCQEIVEPLPSGSCPGCYSEDGFGEKPKEQPEAHVASRNMAEAVNRPKGVEIVGRLLVLLALIGIGLVVGAVSLMGLNDGALPVLALMVLLAGFQVFLGLEILKGRNWARLCYLGITPISLAAGVAGKGGFSVGGIVQIAFFIAFAIILIRPDAIRYFDNPKP